MQGQPPVAAQNRPHFPVNAGQYTNVSQQTQSGYSYPQNMTGQSTIMSGQQQPENPLSLPSPIKPTASGLYPSPAASPAVDPIPRASSLPPFSQEPVKLDRQKSVDDILSADQVTSEDVLRPKVVTSEDIRQQKEEELKKSLKEGPKDPYLDPTVLHKFVMDVEKFEKYVESLAKQPLSGPTPLEKEWKVRVMKMLNDNLPWL
jgi:tyrosine-protein phosphatase non-receptor type 23